MNHFRRRAKQNPTAAEHRITDPDDPLFAVWQLHHEAFEKWRLYNYVNPAQDEPYYLSFIREFDAGEITRRDFPTATSGDPEKVEIELAPHDVVIRFNLRQPLPRLLEQAKVRLERLQAQFKAAGGEVRRRRMLPVKWRLYLRSLDAKTDGATYEQMAEVFFPAATTLPDEDPIKKVEETIRQARRMLRPSAYERIFH